MAEIKNPTSGIADPYWYEWTVGLDQAINMLNPDNNIKSITLQAPDLQGLDDVVIKYHDGSVECIQVKHTREGDQLSFSDIIFRKNSQSYISKFAKDWIKLTQDVRVNKVILYTNRIMNDTPNYRNGLYRPGLVSFLKKLNEQIHTVKRINDITFPEEWKKAWEKFLEELEVLENDKQKLDFLKVLEIQASQPDLLELKKIVINKIESTLQSSIRISEALFDKLVVALFTWTTTHRNEDEISLEDLYGALSIESYDFKGIVSLPTIEPFIESRVEFCEDLERKILSTDKKVIFLSGEAGSGKTNVASFLVNKLNSIISLKYYTFKPLNIQSDYLSADKGGSNPRVLWGDLLLQLKDKLKGQLSKYNVPISIEFIDSIDHLRKEVIRLAEILSELSGKKTIILIDGIDHAARSGQNLSFLNTLLPPESLSDKVCFVIIGQPINSYSNYPTWINDSSVLKIEIPPVTLEDVKSLCENFEIDLNDTDRSSLANFIHHNTKGNILLSIFLIHESQKYSNLSEFESVLQTQNISQGLNLYYEYIWKSAISELGDIFEHLEKILAGLFSLINKGVYFKDLEIIFPNLGIEALTWKNVLDKLFPLIIEREGVYTFFHNDFRIYLQKILEQDSYILKQVSSYLADFLLERCRDIPLKHEHIFNLLSNAQRQNEFFRLMSPEFIKNAIEYRRPLEELEEQISFCLDYINENFNIDNLFRLSLSISTLNQFFQSNQWAEIEYVPYIENIGLKDSEKYFLPVESLNSNQILNILDDALFLIESDEVQRSIELIKKWFGNMNPLELIKLLKITNEEEISEDIQNLLFKYGYIHTLYKRNEYFDFQSPREKYEDLVLAYYSAGALSYLSENRYEDIEQKIEMIAVCFIKDYEAFILRCLNIYTEETIFTLLERQSYESYSLYGLLEINLWAIKNNFTERILPIKLIILEHQLDVFNERASFDRSFKPILLLIIAKSYENEEYGLIFEQFKELDFIRSEEHLDIYCKYLSTAYSIGRLYYQLNNSKTLEYDEFQNHLISILNPNNISLSINHFNLLTATNWLLNLISELSELLPKEFESNLVLVLKDYIKTPNNTLYLEFIWNLLQEHGEKESLIELYSYWMGREGKVWELEFSELHTLSNLFIELATDVVNAHDLKTAQTILSSKIIGYVGRKEYSLFNLLEWFDLVSEIDPKIWCEEGIRILNINSVVSKLGDNRAALDILNSVCRAAMLCGPNDFNMLISLDSIYKSDWKTTMFDNIISYMQHNTFTNEELDLIIEIAIKLFPLYNSIEYHSSYKLNAIYLSDIKDAIIVSKTNEGNLSYIDHMSVKYKQMFEVPQFSRDAYNIEERFFNLNKPPSTIQIQQRINLQEIIKIIKDRYFEGAAHTDYIELAKEVNSLINQLSLKNTKALCNAIYLIINRDNKPWYYDGIDKLYKNILCYLDEDYKMQIFRNINHLFRNSDYPLYQKIFSLTNDIDSFVIAYCKDSSLKEKKEYLNLLVEMHIIWITGYNSVPAEIQYKLNIEDQPVVNNWVDVFKSL